jgi:hypothetical protein
MDRDPNRRPPTAGELLDRLEASITSPNGSVDGPKWMKPAIRTGSLGVSALLVFAVGVAEVVWLVEGSGMRLVAKAAHRFFGVG